jgi:hypothetical protein
MVLMNVKKSPKAVVKAIVKSAEIQGSELRIVNLNSEPYFKVLQQTPLETFKKNLQLLICFSSVHLLKVNEGGKDQ